MTPYFGRSFNPISTRVGGGRLCPPNNTGTPGFSDLPTALNSMTMLLELTSRITAGMKEPGDGQTRKNVIETFLIVTHQD